jgi:[ribosomal protein S5]-alanine N-acetyltransferase
MEERRVAHARELFEALRDPRIYRYLDEDPPRSVEELAEKLVRSESRRSPDGKEHWLNWVVRAESGEVAGYVQATVEESRETNVDYAAMRQMLEIVEAQYETTTLFIVAEAANLPSVCLAQRLGFTLAPAEVSATRHPGPTEVVLWRRAAQSEA